MAIVGDASVVVRAITDKVKGDIEKAFKDATPSVQKAGKDHARAYSQSFSSQLKGDMSKTLGDSFSSPQANAAASKGGKDNAKAYAGSFKSELGRMNLDGVMKNALGGLEGEAKDAVGDAADAAGDEAERGFGNAGGRGGRAFKNALEGEFANSAVSASRAFTGLIATGNILGPAISGLVGSLSAAASGLYAMASAASVAGGALAVLPGSISVAAQSFGALKLAFSGVGDAVSAGLKPVPGTTAAAGRAAVSAANAIADAQRNLGRARQDAADAAADAARRVADAERDVAEAQRNTLALTKQLTAARQEAKESLQQLAFSAEDAGLAEQRAQLNLEDAYKKLQEVQNLPPDNATRRDAELSYKEAELAYREAKDRASDLTKEQAKAAKAGIKGSKEVQDVQKDINDSKQDEVDKEKSLAEARLAQQRQQRDSAQAIADAQRAVARAHQQATSAAAAGTTQANAYATALGQLSPAAQDFVKYLVSIKDEVGKLKAAAGEELFPKLQSSLEPIVQNVFPILEDELRKTGGLLGDAAQGFSDAVSSGEGLNRVKKILQGNNDILKIFTKRGDDGRNTFSKLADVLLRLLDAVQPLTNRFARWVASLVDAADAATNTRKEMGNLRGILDKAGDRAALLGDIFHYLWDVLLNVGKAADSSGEGLLKSFDKATKKLADFTGKDTTQSKMAQSFEQVADNLRDIGDLIVVIGDEFLKLGDNEGVGDLATSLQPAVRNIGDILDEMSKNGDALGDFATSVTEAIKVLTDSGSIDIFLKVLTKVADAFVAIAGSPAGQKILLAAGAFAAVSRSLSLVLRGFSFFGKAIIGGPIAAIRAFSRLKGGLDRLKRGFSTLRSDGIRAAFREMSGASDQAKAAFERQMTTDREKVIQLKLVEEQADKTAFALERVKAAGAPGVGAAAAPVRAQTGAVGKEAGALAAGSGAGGAAVAKNVEKVGASAAKSSGGIGKLGKSLSGLSMALLGVSGPVLLVIAAIAALIGFFVLLYKHSPQFKKFIDGIVGKVKELGKWIGDIFTKYVFPAFDKFFGWVNENLPKAGKIIGDIFNKVIVPVIKVFWKIWSTYFTLVFNIYKKVFEGIRWIVMNVLVPVIMNVVIPYVKLLWKIWSTYFNLLWTVAKKIFGFVADGFRLLWKGIRIYINTVVKPIFKVVRELFSAWWELVKKVTGWIADRFVWVKNKFVAFKDAMSPVIERVKGFFSSLWTALSNAATKIASKVGDILQWFRDLKDDLLAPITGIKNLFSGIATAVKDAFTDLLEDVKGPIRSILKFLNENLIGNINKVTGKFGLTITKIPIGFESGGYTGPGNPKRVAGVVHADEHVIRATSRRKLERQFPGALEHMNKTGQFPSTNGIGGWGPLPDLHLDDIVDLGGDAISGIKNIGEKIAKDGLGKVLEALVNAAKGGLGAAGIKRGTFINDFFYAIMDELAKSAKTWGGSEGKTASGTLIPPGMAGTGNIAPYTGPPGGWTYPLAARYGITQMPNAGHSPSWSVDIGSPNGVGVRAVSAGRVAVAADIGDRSYGRYIKIAHADGSWSLYAHLMRMMVRVGQIVKTGQSIGVSDSYGNATGPHLHFELYDMLRNTYLAMLRRGVRLAKGGVVPAQQGGMLATIGEAGRNERVEPLDLNGMSKRDQYMIDTLNKLMGEGGRGDNFHVYPSPGMNEEQLASMVSRRVAWRRSVGT